MKNRLRIFTMLALTVLVAVSFTSCKHQGYKKDRASGIYYKFYGDRHEDAISPVTGDYVGLVLTIHGEDSVFFPTLDCEMLVDSIYKGDMYDAIRMLHVGDSATFILDGPQFFKSMFNEPDYPFGEDPVYADIKLFDMMTHAQFVEESTRRVEEAKALQAAEGPSIDTFLMDNKIKVKPTESGIYYIPVKRSNGAKPEIMQTVRVHYTGEFLDGTPFDSSIDRGEPFEFTLGMQQVIPGWEEAVMMMHVGEKAKFIIPSALAYGPEGYYNIPPYTPLLFEIELLEIVEAE